MAHRKSTVPRGATMRQAQIAGPSSFEVATAPVPRLSGPGEILVRTVVAGICSGDLMPWYLQKKVGGVLGHEVVGRAVEVGPEVTHLQVGDLVFLHHRSPCLNCPVCQRGDHVHCPVWRTSAIDPGGMAEWIRVPEVNARVDTFAVNDLTPEQAVFIEPLGCSVKALRRLPRLAGEPGVVVGCGVMGLLNLAAARALGSGRLVAVEPDAHRRRLARSFGADEALSPEEASLPLYQSAEFVIIGPGEREVIRQALAYVRPGGTALLFTPTPTGVLMALDLGELYFREISLVPSYSCGPDHTRAAYELLRTEKVEVRSLVTHRFSLEEVQQAYDTARSGGAALKVLITFEEGRRR
ncbi:MAG: alcohol dehydrogenase catalytic domain-containing protein [Gemmataceae bacterium]|nr:alcohol dehydrogenase catalytic domain-containing protein [Gemmataceae bacterium]